MIALQWAERARHLRGVAQGQPRHLLVRNVGRVETMRFAETAPPHRLLA